MTLMNLARLAEWCDVVVTEGTSSFDGRPRTAVRGGWHELLDIDTPALRVVTTDLGGGTAARRQLVQRSGAMPLLAAEPDDRWVLLADADEFLDRDAVLRLIDDRADSPDPVRLGLIPRYGAIDRCALRIHCCWSADGPDLRTSSGPSLPMAGGTLARAGAMKGELTHRIRYSSPIIGRDRTFGTHVTMCDPADKVARKLSMMRHVWDRRVMDEQHLDTMLGAGVHHAGWWINAAVEPEPWLSDLAPTASLRVAGPRLPIGHLRALRAWAEARLDPRVADDLVRAGDEYVASRPHDAVDVLAELDQILLARPTRYTGHVTPDDRENH